MQSAFILEILINQLNAMRFQFEVGCVAYCCVVGFGVFCDTHGLF